MNYGLNLPISYRRLPAVSESFPFRLHESVSRKAVAVIYIRAFFGFISFLKAMGTNDKKIQREIVNYGPAYIKFYCKSLAHRLLRTPEPDREGMTVKSFIDQCKRMANDLAPGNHFYPYKQFNIRLAMQIDSNFLLRRLYLLFRKIHKKPIYS
jgi:hypothetical protein